jgi:UDP-glucose 4-epimerase
MRVLVVGGAGYIGAHVCEELVKAGYEVRIYDDFSNGLKRRITQFKDVVTADVLDKSSLIKAMVGIDSVIHLAAKKAVGESVENPLKYYENNLGGTLNILTAMKSAGVKKIVFSSTAAVYSPSEKAAITELDPTVPLSPYGATKLLAEQLISSVSAAEGFSSVSLRYFNVAGSGSDAMGDNSRDNLVPKVFLAISQGECPEIYGTDYPTPDGTCIRDYIHVSDLALAHIVALKAVEKSQIDEIYNVGSGNGFSVSEVMNEIEIAMGKKLDPISGPRRAGDSPKLVASIAKISDHLGWQPKRSLRDMITSSWSAWQSEGGSR